nr:uncharacterized protein LOC121130245 [Lepeophtheirus salmonis]
MPRGALAQIRFLIVPRLGYSPFFLVTGAHPVVPAVQLDSNMQNAPTSVNELVNTVTDALEKVRVQQFESHLKNREAYNKKVVQQVINVDDEVFLWAPQTDKNRKLATYQNGPFKVLKVINDRMVEIRTNKGPKKVAKDRLRVISGKDISKELIPFNTPLYRTERNRPSDSRLTEENESNNLDRVIQFSYPDSPEIQTIPKISTSISNKDIEDLPKKRDDEEENGKQEDKKENGNMDELEEAYMSEAGAEEIRKEVKNMEESPNKMQGSVEKKNNKRKATPEYKQKSKKLLSAAFDELAALLDGKTRLSHIKGNQSAPTHKVKRNRV